MSRARVHFQARYVSSNLALEGHVTDLSPDGLFFCSDFLDDQGETAQLEIEVPSRGRPLALRGEVRWVKDVAHAGGMGIRFLDVSLEDRALLTSLSRADSNGLGLHTGGNGHLPSGNA